MKYFRLKTGFGKDEFISINETEYPKAIRCMSKGTIGIFEEGTIAGKSIMSILPDWQRAMDYNRDYQLNAEDYELIGQKRQKEYRDFMYESKMAIENEGNVLKLS